MTSLCVHVLFRLVRCSLSARTFCAVSTRCLAACCCCSKREVAALDSWVTALHKASESLRQGLSKPAVLCVCQEVVSPEEALDGGLADCSQDVLGGQCPWGMQGRLAKAEAPAADHSTRAVTGLTAVRAACRLGFEPSQSPAQTCCAAVCNSMCQSLLA